MLQKNYHKFDFKYPKIGKKLCKKLIGWGGAKNRSLGQTQKIRLFDLTQFILWNIKGRRLKLWNGQGSQGGGAMYENKIGVKKSEYLVLCFVRKPCLFYHGQTLHNFTKQIKN